MFPQVEQDLVEFVVDRKTGLSVTRDELRSRAIAIRDQQLSLFNLKKRQKEKYWKVLQHRKHASLTC